MNFTIFTQLGLALKRLITGYLDINWDKTSDALLSDLKDQRVLASTAGFTAQTIADILNENVPELKGKLPVGKPGSGNDLAIGAPLDNSKAKKLIGELIPFKTCVLDSVNQILQSSS